MTVSAKDKVVIQDLARQVAEIAAEPINNQKRDMWVRLNRLERVRPLIHVQAIDESIWAEMLPPESLKTTDPFLCQHEKELRKKIYCWEYFRDDRKQIVWDRVQKIREDIEGFADSVADAALRFTISFPAVTTVIPGMRSEKHLLANVESVKRGGFPGEMVQKLARHRWIRDYYK